MPIKGPVLSKILRVSHDQRIRPGKGQQNRRLCSPVGIVDDGMLVNPGIGGTLITDREGLEGRGLGKAHRNPGSVDFDLGDAAQAVHTALQHVLVDIQLSIGDRILIDRGQKILDLLHRRLFIDRLFCQPPADAGELMIFLVEGLLQFLIAGKP